MCCCSFGSEKDKRGAFSQAYKSCGFGFHAIPRTGERRFCHGDASPQYPLADRAHQLRVAGIPASERRAVIGLQTRIKATGRIIATQFAIVLTITGDVVTRVQMLEDGFDVSKAARA
jgi:hypothetical protein